MRADVGLRAGDLDVAEDYAERALELGHQLGAELFGSLAMPVVWLERGEIEAASELVESVPLPEASLKESFGVILLAQRGRVRVARGDLQAGLADLLEADRRMSAAGWQLSVLTDWVPASTQASVALGRREEASRLAARELAQARAYGAPRRLGIAMSVVGALDSGATEPATAREAVEVLERAGARLEQARALVRVGTGLRAAGRREEAREPLSQAVDMAHRIGAHALAEHARAELVASGARPRRMALSGPESLTPAEFRTARMAAEGLTNRQIAQALFVSTKTIETQLSQAYFKLEIHSRGDLARALGERGGLRVR
jgi:DNA-binding CsgD family transcriptional regulator